MPAQAAEVLMKLVTQDMVYIMHSQCEHARTLSLFFPLPCFDCAERSDYAQGHSWTLPQPFQNFNGVAWTH